MGFEPARRALSRRSCGLCPVPGVAEGCAIFMGDKNGVFNVNIVVLFSGTISIKGSGGGRGEYGSYTQLLVGGSFGHGQCI